MKKFMLLHGVTTIWFGKRNPEQYGTVTLDEINENVQRLARELGVSVTCFQTNDEGKWWIRSTRPIPSIMTAS